MVLVEIYFHDPQNPVLILKAPILWSDLGFSVGMTGTGGFYNCRNGIGVFNHGV